MNQYEKGVINGIITVFIFCSALCFVMQKTQNMIDKELIKLENKLNIEQQTKGVNHGF